ncbi:MAG: hypothetical protein LBW85_06580 [Deltaproteobacteria bacterium]|jgi:hypothetical protein|nr:hypothetical protein [Deltaproteobacteria bacterium]
MGRARALTLALAAALALALAFPGNSAAAGSALDLFLELPAGETYGLTVDQRKELARISGASKEGYTAPSQQGFYLEIKEPAITLMGIHGSPIVYKLFPGKPGSPDVFIVCRSRQTAGPSTSYEKLPSRPEYDLLVYQSGLSRAMMPVRLHDYLPPVGVLDFVTRDTLEDALAGRVLEAIDKEFGACLTCHASTEDRNALDIVTVTSINAHSCGGFLPQFKLIPLSWNGEVFTKPYDRAASPDEPWDRGPGGPHGIYYNQPGS